MNKYLLYVPFTSSGYRIVSVEACSKIDALNKYKEYDGDIFEDETIESGLDFIEDNVEDFDLDECAIKVYEEIE